MKKFEYDRFHIGDVIPDTKKLDQLGDQGWELAYAYKVTSSHLSGIFKREKADEKLPGSGS